jgi:Arc/MetJ family transcription regulator
MTTYLKEISTGKIHKFQEGESPVFPELFIPATQIEIDELLLNEAKTQKYIELIEAYNIAI